MLVIKEEEDQLDYIEEDENSNAIHNNSPPKSPEEEIILDNYNVENNAEDEEVEALELKSLNDENVEMVQHLEDNKNFRNGNF